MSKSPMVPEAGTISPPREDTPCNSLGASLTWLPPQPQSQQKTTYITFCEAFHQVWASLAVHCMVIMVGMTLGFSAILLPQLEETNSEIPITRSDASWLASIVSIVAPIGSLSAGPVVQWLGSKNTIRLSLIPYACGWLLISFANGLPMLLVGRLITGLATTFGNTPCIVYITEVSAPHMRSMLTATGPALASFGILTAYLLGWLFTWRTVALVPAAWNLVCIVSLATIPESPVWLISHERFEEARKAIYWFHGVKVPDEISHVPDKVKGLIKSIEINAKVDVIEDGMGGEDYELVKRRKKAESTYGLLLEEHNKKNVQGKDDRKGNLLVTGEKLLSDGSVKKITSPTGADHQKRNQTSHVDRLKMLFMCRTGLKPLILLTVIFLLQQYAGVYITLFYAVNVFKEMGGGGMDEYIASIMVGLVRFVMSLVNIWLFRRIGRRPLCLFSAFGMTVCMMISGTSLFLKSTENGINFGNVTTLSGPVDLMNGPSTISISSPAYVNVSNDGMLNLNLLLYDQDQPQIQRSERSLNESSSDLLSWNNSLMSGNSSFDALSDNQHDKVNGERTRKESYPATVEYPSPKFVNYQEKSIVLLESENDSTERMTTGSIRSSEPSGSSSLKKSSIVPTVCMLLYVCVSMVGFLAIPWTITAELFPTEIRSLANSIVLSLANVLLFSALQAYPFMLDVLEPYGVLWLFAVVSAIGGVFFYFFLPETHGKNLAEIENYFTENTVYTYPCKKE